MEETMNKSDETEATLVNGLVKEGVIKYGMLSLWSIAGAILITLGCIFEPYTVVGHHLLLIIAGAAIGIGVYRSMK
jgi:hypothetical protein